VLFPAVTLTEIAEYLAALGRTDLEVYSGKDGVPLGLSTDERQRLAAERQRLAPRGEAGSPDDHIDGHPARRACDKDATAENVRPVGCVSINHV
jgi:hypothetical protein